MLVDGPDLLWQYLFVGSSCEVVYNASLGEAPLKQTPCLFESTDFDDGTQVMTAPPYPTPRGLLRGKTLVVTASAGSGIGFSAAKRAAEEGATVLLSDANERRLGEAAKRIADEVGCSRPPTYVCDVTVQDQVDGLRDAALRELGHVDVLINNAGLGGEVQVIEMSDAQWSSVLDVSLGSVFRMSRAFLTIRRERCGCAVEQRSRRIVRKRLSDEPSLPACHVCAQIRRNRK